MTFANIEYFFLLLLLIPYILWYFMSRKKREPSMKIFDIKALKYARKSWKIYLIHIPFVLRLLTFVMIVCVLARPQTSNSWKDTEVEGIDIMLSIDVSTSMLAEDLKPNRIEATRNVVTEFISGRPNDNIGITVFAGEAFTQCPMTTDHAILLNMFKDVGCELVLRGLIEDRTAIGMGLSNSISRLKDSKAKSKVIILLTDGVNNCGDISPLTAAEIAKKFGIRIYTIGVGTNGEAPYPYPLPGGGVHYIRTKVEIDNETLTQIAEMTDGKFYRATSNKKLKQIYHDIDRLEKTKLNVKNYSKRYEAYQLFGIIALLSFFFEIILRVFILRRIP